MKRSRVGAKGTTEVGRVVSQELVDEAPNEGLRHTEAALCSDATLRGLTRGVVNEQLRQRLPCLIFGDAYPAWLHFVGQLGYSPVAVIVKHHEFRTAVEDSLPPGGVVWGFHDWSKLLELSLWHFKGKSAVAFVDGRITQQILDLAQSFGIATVLGTATARRPVRGWQHRVARVKH